MTASSRDEHSAGTEDKAKGDVQCRVSGRANTTGTTEEEGAGELKSTNETFARNNTDGVQVGQSQPTKVTEESVAVADDVGGEYSESEVGMEDESGMQDESSVSLTARSVSVDLDDIVNNVARRAGRRKVRKDKLAAPVRSKHTSPNPEKQVRVPRGARTKDARNSSPMKPQGLRSDESGGEGNAQALKKKSTLKRLTTVDSRDRFIRMLDDKTLTGFRDVNQKKAENDKPRTYMSRLYLTLQDCLQQLGGRDLTSRKLEAMAILIHECMSGDSRNYHSVQHVFEISKDYTDDPIAVLAAMFHDCIYYNVDGSLSPLQEEVLHGCFVRDELKSASSTAGTSHMTCRAQSACATDSSLCMVESIFGFDHEEEVTAMKGLNEFLSAVVAVRQLKPHLADDQCARIAVCIAGTIPFRNKQVEGKLTHMQTLYENMEKTNIYFGLGMHDDIVVDCIQVACKVANADIGNFGSDDIYYFLDNTWSLLTETNTTLRRSFLFTVMEFQHSLYKMNGFFHFLDPASIFATFQNVPPEEEITKLTEQARQNLKLGQRYVGAKLLSASVLAAFAALTGGDAPLSLFVGDLPSRHHQSQSINDNLPSGDKPLFHNDDEEVQSHLDMLCYQILSGGRRSETSFDVKQSPLGAFLYAVVGDRGLTMILKNKNLYPMTEECAIDLLSCLPREVVRYLAKTISAVAISRAVEIMEVVDNLPVKVRSNGRTEMPNTKTIAEEGE